MVNLRGLAENAEEEQEEKPCPQTMGPAGDDVSQQGSKQQEFTNSVHSWWWRVQHHPLTACCDCLCDVPVQVFP